MTLSAPFDIFQSQCQSLSDSSDLELNKNDPIYIFGAGNFGRDVAKALLKNKFNLLGFVESTPKLKSIDALPVLALQDIPVSELSAQLLIGIFNRDVPFDELKAYALKIGFEKIFMPWDIYNFLSEDLGWRYWLSKKNALKSQVSNIQMTYGLLSDEESRQTLLGICRFRLGLQDSYASFKHPEKQYFNELTLNRFFGLECSYIDCGAYNGDTFLEAGQSLNLNDAYLFEPDPNNFSQLVSAARSSRLRPVCIPMAVADRYQILSFRGGGEGGTISEEGDVHIAAVSLDQILPKSKVDFIKFDVEGAEIAAINGAEELIKRSRPTLVLSMYHRPNDLWEIPALLAKYCHNYKFYLRQHYHNSFDSVLYAIPQ